MIDISIIRCLADNYSYLIRDKETNIVGVIDPSEFNPIDLQIQKTYKKLDFILNTHHHLDHIGGNTELKKKYNSKIVCSSLDEKRIPGIDIKKNDGDNFSLGKTEFKVIDIPGHTMGHIAFFSEKAGVIFTGDTLFSLGCGKVFEGTFEQMFNSLQKISRLPKNTKIYCGHEYTIKNGEFCISIDKNNAKIKDRIQDSQSKFKKKLPSVPISIGEELETNIFLRCDNKKIRKSLKMDNSSKLEVFTRLRSLKDNF